MIAMTAATYMTLNAKVMKVLMLQHTILMHSLIVVVWHQKIWDPFLWQPIHCGEIDQLSSSNLKFNKLWATMIYCEWSMPGVHEYCSVDLVNLLQLSWFQVVILAEPQSDGTCVMCCFYNARGLSSSHEMQYETSQQNLPSFIPQIASQKR